MGMVTYQLMNTVEYFENMELIVPERKSYKSCKLQVCLCCQLAVWSALCWPAKKYL